MQVTLKGVISCFSGLRVINIVELNSCTKTDALV